jgi:hypothetical protein
MFKTKILEEPDTDYIEKNCRLPIGWTNRFLTAFNSGKREDEHHHQPYPVFCRLRTHMVANPYVAATGASGADRQHFIHRPADSDHSVSGRHSSRRLSATDSSVAGQRQSARRPEKIAVAAD